MAANNDTRCAEYSLVLIHLYNVSGREMDVVDPWNCTQARQKLHSIEDNWTAYAELFCLLYIIICTPMLFLQLTSLPIIFAQKNFWKNICYKILFANGVVDSIQLGTILIFAILRLTIGLIDDRIVKLGGAIAIPIWSLVVIQHLLLAINRLLVVLRVRYPDSKLIPSENVEKRATKITLLLSWLLFLSVFALFMSPLAGMTFDYAVVIFRFNLLLPHTSTFQTVNWLLTGWMPLVCFCCYAVTVYNVRKIRTDTSQSKLNTSLFNASERRLLIQAIILYTFMTFLICGWNIIDRCNGTILTGTTCTARIFGHKLFEVSLELHSLLVEAPWMIFCGLSPILLLSMNSEFRQCYLQLYTCRKSQQLDQKIHTSTAVTMDQ